MILTMILTRIRRCIHLYHQRFNVLVHFTKQLAQSRKKNFSFKDDSRRAKLIQNHSIIIRQFQLFDCIKLKTVDSIFIISISNSCRN